MKQLSVLFIFCILVSSCGKYVPTEIENGKLLGIIPVKHNQAYYQVTQKVAASREDLFRQSRRWAAFRIPEASKALAISDNLIGDVIGNGSNVSVNLQEKRIIAILPKTDYSISIECYENEYRVTVTNIKMIGSPTPHSIEVRHTGIPKKKAVIQFKEIDRKTIELITDLDEFVRTEVKKT